MTRPTDTTKANLCDRAIERYVEWREACEAVRVAYERWSRAAREDAAIAFAAYRIALDREDRAAGAYASVIARLGDLMAEDDELRAHRLAQVARRN